MAHNLESENGEVAFALRGKPAWHNLANRIFNQDEDVTTQTMLEEAKLANWNVRRAPTSEPWPRISVICWAAARTCASCVAWPWVASRSRTVSRWTP